MNAIERIEEIIRNTVFCEFDERFGGVCVDGESRIRASRKIAKILPELVEVDREEAAARMYPLVHGLRVDIHALSEAIANRNVIRVKVEY